MTRWPALRRSEALPAGVQIPPGALRICVWEVYTRMSMPDTKRGRERKGRTKRQQRREHEIERALEARDRSLDFEELYEDEEIELEI